MKKLIIKEPSDVIVLLNRRKWWILSAFLPLAAVAALVAILLPSVYVSETLVLVQPKDVPNDVVKDFITLDTQQRLVSIQETALSRTNLLRILNDLPNEFSELRKLSEPKQIETLRKRISIDFTTSGRGRDSVVPYFKIAYQDRDPRLAQKVTDKLATFFIERDAKTREDQVYGTADFLDKELQKVSNQLNTEEQQLAQLKERYQYELPDQLDANLRTLDRLQNDLNANAESRDRYLTFKLDLERQLSETSPVISREQLRQQSTGRSAASSPLVQKYRQTEMALAEARSRYTDKHPDVIRLQAELARLRDQIPPEDLAEASSDGSGGNSPTEINEPNPVYQKLNAQMNQVTTELRILDQKREQIQKAISQYTQRVENTPRREQAIAAHQRQYDALQEKYKDLESKLSQARLASSLESTQKGEQFQVIDPASFPLQPAKPNRWIVLAGGLAAALALSIGLAIGIDFLDQRIWSAGEVTELLRLPVIGEIPEILSDQDLKSLRRRAILQGVAYLALTLLTGAAIYVVYTTPRIRTLGADTFARLLGW